MNNENTETKGSYKAKISYDQIFEILFEYEEDHVFTLEDIARENGKNSAIKWFVENFEDDYIKFLEDTDQIEALEAFKKSSAKKRIRASQYERLKARREKKAAKAA